jgi:hypothetical protein
MLLHKTKSFTLDIFLSSDLNYLSFQMNFGNTAFLLGVNDPEMQAIRQILDERNAKCIQATNGGRLVHPGNAYVSDGPILDENVRNLVLIECKPQHLSKNVAVFVIDHHAAGHPGFDKEYSEFWEASSLGQLVTLLNGPQFCECIQVSERMLHIAAMDHCLAAARRGLCPGIIPDVLDEIQMEKHQQRNRIAAL